MMNAALNQMFGNYISLVEYMKKNLKKIYFNILKVGSMCDLWNNFSWKSVFLRRTSGDNEVKFVNNMSERSFQYV